MPEVIETTKSVHRRRSYKQKYPFRSMIALGLLALGLVLSVVVIGMTQDLRNRAASGEYGLYGGKAAPGTKVNITIDSTAGTDQTVKTDAGDNVTSSSNMNDVSNKPSSSGVVAGRSGSATALAGQTFGRQSAEMAASSTNCPPGDRTCRNGYWYVCTEDGQSYQKRGACSNNDSDPSHGARDCKDLEVKCEGTKPFRCQDGEWKNASGIANLESLCSDRESSYDDGGRCKLGFGRCLGATYQTCRAEQGQRIWVNNDEGYRNCQPTTPAQGQVCNQGERQCRNGKVQRCVCSESGGNCSWQPTANDYNSEKETYCAKDFYQDENGNSNGVGGGQGGGNNNGRGGGGRGGSGSTPTAAPLTCSPATYIQVNGTSTGPNSFSQWSTIRLACSGARTYTYVVKDVNNNVHYASQQPEAEARFIGRTAGKYLVECTPVQ